CVGTLTDHVAPWRSVYKLHLLTDTEITFALTTGGHNAGIVSEPGRRNRSYRVRTRPYDGKYIDPDAYLGAAEQREGSWWPAWQSWLAARSGEQLAPPAVGAPEKGYNPLEQAPGTYVFLN
ncbi:MAG TPA: poly-beta-hydroxybutyrate polymerase, partial [Rhodocyclaceae bacterium]|nr:poly-beta-hydroxybutyrate polymerase [Rhodocyclaceae bacterium]